MIGENNYTQGEGIMWIKVIALALTFTSTMSIGTSAVDHGRVSPFTSLETLEKGLWTMCEKRHTPKIEDYDKLIDAATKCEEHYGQIMDPSNPECQERWRIYHKK